MNRLRAVAFVIQPQFVVDDGEHLVPLPVAPITVTAAEWGDVLAIVAAAAEQLRQQIEPLQAVKGMP